mmetsp:Transcript_101371/g.327143  ORF Transcript_101371/g.327143 Transcript_101371/m.327143 type:complete len:257 (+) Transcript_101371:65-835(+)
MPHLLIERVRSCPALHGVPGLRVERSGLGACLIEVVDIVAAVIFVAGSICFLPSYAVSLKTFILGCYLFVLGSVLYCLICGFALAEALATKGVAAFEVLENGLYLLGSAMFLVGSLLYLPPDHQYRLMPDMGGPMSLGQICETVTFLEKQFAGAVLFVTGSMLFTGAAFGNLLKRRKADDWILSAVASLYMAGSVLFAVGSLAFIPRLGCGEQLLLLGAWGFIVGSALFLLGGCLSLWRTLRVLSSKEGEFEALVR